MYSDASTLVVNWVDGESLAERSLTESVCLQMASTVGGAITDLEKIDPSDTLAAVSAQVARLMQSRLLGGDTAKHVESTMLKIPAPVYELEGLGFADAALKNYLISSDREIHYIDVFGIYRVRVGHNLMRHLLFIPGPCREKFLQRYVSVVGEPSLTEYLPYHYAMYLLRIAVAKSVGGRALVIRRRRAKAIQALDHLTMFLEEMDRDKEAGLSHVLNRSVYT